MKMFMYLEPAVISDARLIDISDMFTPVFFCKARRWFCEMAYNQIHFQRKCERVYISYVYSSAIFRERQDDKNIPNICHRA